MIAFVPTGSVPAALGASLLPRIASACRAVRGIPRGKAVVGLRFVSLAEMRRLNRIHRKKDRPTDVLSFSVEEGRRFPHPERSAERELGDLVICAPYAVREARRRLIAPKEELTRLIVHGVMHLVGWDHATQKEEDRMFALQEKIVERILS